MSTVILDDHLLRDVLADDISDDLGAILRRAEPATTNLYYARLCRGVVAARGGKLTGIWPADRRRALGRALLELPRTVEIVPMSALAFRMAEIADDHGLSTLGAEAVATAERSAATLCVWSGDDGPRIRAASLSLDLSYRTVTR